jgi:16S rRNA (cytosine967-C5)-methyltransferase
VPSPAAPPAPLPSGAATPPAHGSIPALALLLDSVTDVVLAVRAGRSLTHALAACPLPLRPGVQALSYTVLRILGSAEAARAAMAPKTPPPNVDALLCAAIALLWLSPRPPYADHTVVDQAVQTTHRRAPAAVPFVNAVLRRFVREREAIVAAARRAPVGAFNHPLWWIDRIKHDWPGHWAELLEQAGAHPPLVLRVNARRTTPAEYVQRLAYGGRAAQVVGPQAVWLHEPCPVQQLPGFADGDVSVQDAAAQRAAPLLLGHGAAGVSPAAQALPGATGLAPGARVLDACAAPGGKTAHLLELADLDLLALDSDPHRITRVHDALGRLKLSAQVQVGDARRPRDWWDGRPFDAILLDAPCTASGIVRRHPDIRWLRRAGDVGALAETQSQMLEALWPLLKPGGRLLFATCSVFRAEGQDRIDAFLQHAGRADAWLDTASPGHLLPLAHNPPNGAEAAVTHDGFFYALLHKRG